MSYCIYIASLSPCIYNGVPVAGAMDNKYTKIAIILVFTSFVVVSLIFAVIVLAVRGPSWLGKISGPSCTQEQVNGTGR